MGRTVQRLRATTKPIITLASPDARSLPDRVGVWYDYNDPNVIWISVREIIGHIWPLTARKHVHSRYRGSITRKLDIVQHKGPHEIEPHIRRLGFSWYIRADRLKEVLQKFCHRDKDAKQLLDNFPFAKLWVFVSKGRIARLRAKVEEERKALDAQTETIQRLEETCKENPYEDLESEYESTVQVRMATEEGEGEEGEGEEGDTALEKEKEIST